MPALGVDRAADDQDPTVRQRDGRMLDPGNSKGRTGCPLLICQDVGRRERARVPLAADQDQPVSETYRDMGGPRLTEPGSRREGVAARIEDLGAVERLAVHAHAAAEDD